MRLTPVMILLLSALLMAGAPALADSVDAGAETFQPELSTSDVTCLDQATCDAPSVEVSGEIGGGNAEADTPDPACLKEGLVEGSTSQDPAKCQPSEPKVQTGVARLYVDVNGIDQTSSDSSEEAEVQSTQSAGTAGQDMDYAMAAGILAGTMGLTAAGAVATIGVRRFATFLLGPLAARLEPSELLEDETRQAIYETVKEDPGINLRALADELDLAWGTLLHHLHKLENAHMVVTKRYGKYRRCFLNGSTYSQDEKARLAALSTPSTARVAEYVLENPGSTQSEIGEALGVTASTVLWHAKRLKDVSLIESRRDGRYVKYFPQLEQHEKAQLVSA